MACRSDFGLAIVLVVLAVAGCRQPASLTSADWDNPFLSHHGNDEFPCGRASVAEVEPDVIEQQTARVPTGAEQFVLDRDELASETPSEQVPADAEPE